MDEVESKVPWRLCITLTEEPLLTVVVVTRAVAMSSQFPISHFLLKFSARQIVRSLGTFKVSLRERNAGWAKNNNWEKIKKTLKGANSGLTKKPGNLKIKAFYVGWRRTATTAKEFNVFNRTVDKKTWVKLDEFSKGCIFIGKSNGTRNLNICMKRDSNKELLSCEKMFKMDVMVTTGWIYREEDEAG